MTDSEKIEQAAKAEVMHVNEVSKDDVGEYATDINLFKAGVIWRDANPKPLPEDLAKVRDVGEGV